jgi:hypothetical protein
MLPVLAEDPLPPPEQKNSTGNSTGREYSFSAMAF